MITTNEKSKIVNSFGTLNDNIIYIFNPLNINFKYYLARQELVDTQVRRLINEVKVLVNNLSVSETIIIEFDNTISIIENEIILKYKNQILRKYTKEAINSGSAILLNELKKLKAEYLVILETKKSKNKSKFPDVIISENEFALFIILAQKNKLISRNHLKNEDRASAFSTLTNISENSIRQNTSSKYYVKPQTLMLDRENLTVLSNTLIEISKEIDCIKELI